MAPLKARLLSYYEPGLLVVLSVFFLCKTLLFHPLTVVFDFAKFRQLWFQSLWKVIGPKMAESPYQVPYISQLLARAKGCVLEFGPGTGDQARHFRPEQITHLYGAEPNVFLHEKLIQNCRAVGIHNYTVIPSGAQPSTLIPALKQAGLLEGTTITDGIFDTIVTVKSLCSAPPDELEDTIRLVHKLLKPGGEFIFFEHVHSHDDLFTSILVFFTNLIWPHLMGNCRLDGKLDEILRKDSQWASKDISNIREYRGFEMIRYVKGSCRTRT